MSPRVRIAGVHLPVLAVVYGCGDTQGIEAQMGTSVELVEIASVGVLDGAEEFVLGTVRDVRASGDGSFFVLDGSGRLVRWYDSDGSYRGGLTTKGQGPGEIEIPLAIDVSSDGTLSVLDLGNRRISVYRTTSGDLPFVASMSVPLSPYSYNERNLCRVADRWYLQHLMEGSVIRAYGEDGSVLHSWQTPHPPSEGDLGGLTPIAEIVMNSGMLLCAEDQSRIVAVGLRSETVRAYSLDGALLWERQIEGLVPERYEDLGNPSDGTHVGISLVRWSEGSALIQFEHWTGLRRTPDSVRIESIEISLDDGQEVSRTDQLPVIVEVAWPLVYSYENEPFPRVLVLERR